MAIQPGLFQAGANRLHDRGESEKDRKFRADEAEKASLREAGMTALRSVLGLGSNLASSAFDRYQTKSDRGEMDLPEQITTLQPRDQMEPEDSRAARRGIDLGPTPPAGPGAAPAPAPKASPKPAPMAAALAGGPKPLDVPKAFQRPTPLATLKDDAFGYVSPEEDAREPRGAPAESPSRRDAEAEGLAAALGIEMPKPKAAPSVAMEPIPERNRPAQVPEEPRYETRYERPLTGEERHSKAVADQRDADYQLTLARIRALEQERETAGLNAQSQREMRILKAKAEQLKAETGMYGEITKRTTANAQAVNAGERTYSKGRATNAPTHRAVFDGDRARFVENPPGPVGGTPGKGSKKPKVVSGIPYAENDPGIITFTKQIRDKHGNPVRPSDARTLPTDEVLADAATNPVDYRLPVKDQEELRYWVGLMQEGAKNPNDPDAVANAQQARENAVKVIRRNQQSGSTTVAAVKETLQESPDDLAGQQAKAQKEAAAGRERVAEAYAGAQKDIGDLQAMTQKIRPLDDSKIAAGIRDDYAARFPNRRGAMPDGITNGKGALSKSMASRALAGQALPADAPDVKGMGPADRALYEEVRMGVAAAKKGAAAEVDTLKAAAGRRVYEIAVKWQQAGGTLDGLDAELRKIGLQLPPQIRQAPAPGPSEVAPPQPGKADPLDDLGAQIDAENWPAAKKRRVFMAQAAKLGLV